MATQWIDHAHQAWDFLTHHIRTYRLQNLHAVFRMALDPQFDDVQKMATFASRSTKVFGFTTEVMFVVMANIESRQQLTSCCPAASLMLAEVALGTDDLETEFGMLVRGCGAKPSFEAAFGFQEKCDYLFYTRRNQHKHGLAIPKSTKCHCSYHDAMQLKDRG